MKIGFIGVGNMAQAIIKGLIKSDFKAADVIVHSAHTSTYEPFANQYGLTAVSSNSELVAQADIVVLAVKPYIVETVLNEIKSVLTKQQVIVSLASGISLAELQQQLSDQQPILRTMPNVNVEVGQGMTAVVANQPLDIEPVSQAVAVFNQIGQTIQLAEDDFPIFSAIAGSAPAYAYLFIDALSRAGVKYGLKKTDATKIAAQVAQGSAQMILESNEVPYALIDKVSSPGGTTVAGLLAMEEAGLSTAVVKGIDATVNKELNN